MNGLNRKELKNILAITILVAVIFSVVFYLLFHFFFYLFFIRSENYLSSGIGAFMGAFSAFIFLIIEKSFSKYRERRVKHLNALVKAEYVLNENLQFISDNLFLLDGFIEALKNGLFHVGGFNDLLWDREILFDLANLDIINKLGDYAIGVRKANRDIAMLEEWYAEIKNALLDGHISKPIYDANLPNIIKKITIVRKYFVKIDEKTQIRQSEVRVMTKDKNFIDWFFDKITNYKLPDSFDNKVEKEKVILKQEIEDIKNKSEEELEEIVK